MKTRNIVILVAALALVAVLVMSSPKSTPKVGAVTSRTSNQSFFSVLLGGLLSTRVTAPSPTPGLSSSKAAADRAVAAGDPVSNTTGNEIIEPRFMDASSAVSDVDENPTLYA